MGCASSTYKIVNRTNTSAEFLISPDRIVMECETVVLDDGEVNYGFMFHILDDAKTSFTLVQTSLLDKKGCQRRLNKIGKILKTGEQIYFAASGDILEPRKVNVQKYNFPAHGSFSDNGRSFQFLAVANEHGLCFAAFSEEEKPCPPEPFPRIPIPFSK